MRRLRRRAPEPGEHDAIALKVANKRILDLEMDLAAERRRHVRFVDRHRAMVEQHRQGCTHAQELEDTRQERDEAQAQWSELFQRFRGVLASLRAHNDQPTETIPAIEAGDDQ